MKKLIAAFSIVIIFIACNTDSKKTESASATSDTITAPETQAAPAPAQADIYGSYADDAYAKKDEGYDWVSVSVKPGADQSILVSVRSRADKKKPTCTFDAKAQKISDYYAASIDGKRILFTFNNNKLTITGETPESAGILAFYCSGGATLAGTYTKLDGEPDPKQIDPTTFMKVLNLQDIGFNVSAVRKDGKHSMTIFTVGLKGKDYRETTDISGEQIVDAEVEDLNADGSPELFVFTQSDGSGSYGKVYAFSVNNKKSMSQVYIEPTADNPKINAGYMGHDRFSVVENKLVQQFPIYKKDDSNSNPTGGTRQVVYTLKEGEAMRKLEIHKVTDL